MIKHKQLLLKPALHLLSLDVNERTGSPAHLGGDAGQWERSVRRRRTYVITSSRLDCGAALRGSQSPQLRLFSCVCMCAPALGLYATEEISGETVSSVSREERRTSRANEETWFLVVAERLPAVFTHHLG